MDVLTHWKLPLFQTARSDAVRCDLYRDVEPGDAEVASGEAEWVRNWLQANSPNSS